MKAHRAWRHGTIAPRHPRKRCRGGGAQGGILEPELSRGWLPGRPSTPLCVRYHSFASSFRTRLLFPNHGCLLIRNRIIGVLFENVRHYLFCRPQIVRISNQKVSEKPFRHDRPRETNSRAPPDSRGRWRSLLLVQMRGEVRPFLLFQR
jgi:hypothetical protein